MYKTRLLKALSLIVCIVLIAAVALFTTGCSDKRDADITASISSESTTAKELGEGKTSFNFEVVDDNGNLTSFVINTDEKTVGDALLKVGLIDGEDGPYGLYGRFMLIMNMPLQVLTLPKLTHLKPIALKQNEDKH